MRLQKKDIGEEVWNFASSSSLHCRSSNPVYNGAGGSSTGSTVTPSSQQPDTCKMGAKFLPQRGSDTNANVLHVCIVMGTSSRARKMHKLTSSQLSLPQAWLNLKGCDVCVHVCQENVFVWQLHIEGIQVHSDVHEQGQASKPSGVRNVIGTGKVLTGRWQSPAAGCTHEM